LSGISYNIVLWYRGGWPPLLVEDRGARSSHFCELSKKASLSLSLSLNRVTAATKPLQ
jgi:hypothetical protein